MGRRWRGGRDDFTAFHDEEGGFGTGKGSVGSVGGSRRALAGAVVAESTPAAADADDAVVSSSTTITAATTHRPPDLAMVDRSALSILIDVCVRGWIDSASSFAILLIYRRPVTRDPSAVVNGASYRHVPAVW